MKKLFVLSLALVMVLALATTCFAAATPVTLTEGVGSASGNITVTYAAGDSDNAKVYAVDVEFGELTFAYKAAGTSAWSTTDHNYGTVAATWTPTGNTVTVTNHSNSAMTATFTAAVGETGITVAYSGDNVSGNVLSLANCETTNAAVSGTVTVTLSGTITEAPEQPIALTVAIAPVAAPQ